jgi:hypothetical protein
VLVFLLLLWSPFVPTASAHTQHSQQAAKAGQVFHIAVGGNGRITGQLIDATNSKKILANQKVTLQVAQGTSTKDLATATTDAHGTYVFNNLSTDKTLTYVVYILFQGGQYTSSAVTLDTNASQTTNLTVYEATTSTAKLAVLQATILMREPDVQHGTLTFSEIFFIRNLGTQAFVGTFNTDNGQHKPNALRFSLPGNAKAITLGTGFDGYHTFQVDLGFATDAAIPPGESQFSFSYQVPYTGGTYDLSYTTVYPTVQLSVLIPTDIHADSGFLSSGGVITTSQHPFQSFQGNDLTMADQIHIQLQGLPTPTSAQSTSPINATTVWLIVVVLVLLAIVLATYFLFAARLRYRAATSRRGRKAKTSRTNSHGKTGRGVVELRPEIPRAETRPRDEKHEALLQELLSLDQAFEAGKLSKTAYQERRAKAKARLRSLLRETQDKPDRQKQETSRKS